MWFKLVGNRTQILGALYVVLQVAVTLGLPIPAVVFQIIAGLGAVTLGAKVNRVGQ